MKLSPKELGQIGLSQTPKKKSTNITPLKIQVFIERFQRSTHKSSYIDIFIVKFDDNKDPYILGTSTKRS